MSYSTLLLAGKKENTKWLWLSVEWASQEGVKKQKFKRHWAKISPV